MTQTILAEKTPINNTYQCLILIFFLNYHCPPSYCSCLFGVLCEVAKATTSQNDDEWQHHEHEVQVMKGDKWQLLILFHPAPWICMKISWKWVHKLPCHSLEVNSWRIEAGTENPMVTNYSSTLNPRTHLMMSICCRHSFIGTTYSR